MRCSGAAFVFLLLIQAPGAHAAITVTGGVNLNTYGNQADSFTHVKWNYSDLVGIPQVKSYAEIELNYSLVATNFEDCINFYEVNNQNCTTIAEANSCTDGCPYTGRGEGFKKTPAFWLTIGTWGDVTKICESGPGN